MTQHTTRIELNNGHDWDTVTANKAPDDFEIDSVEIAFAGRDPTTVNVRLQLIDDVRAIGRALIDAANYLEESSADEWRSLDEPPTSPDGRSSVRVLGILADGHHVFAQYTPFYLGRSDETSMLWTCENFSAGVKPVGWLPLPKLSKL